MTDALRMTLACGRYDRVQDVASGLIDTDGLRIDFIHPAGGVPEMFFRMARYQEFDACELSFSSYVTSLEAEDPPFVAVPVFLSRSFRHGNIWVNDDAGISGPEDLRGKRIGVTEYGTSASVWIRGLLRDEYGLEPEEMEWHSFREEKIDSDRRGVRLHSLERRPMAEHLASGAVDAVLGSMKLSGRGVSRLWPDFRAREESYYERTGIFPIMHLLAIRREVYERDPWIARTLYRSFSEARLACEARMISTSVSSYLLPWVAAEAEEQRERFGGPIWTYGAKANEPTLDRFLDYMHGQGLTSRRFKVAELFVPYQPTNNDPRFDE